MLLQTNSYIVPPERRAEHARLIRRFRQALSRIGCDQFEVYEQVGVNWSPGTNGRYVQIMRFRDRQHQQAVQAAERHDPGSQAIIAEFCELINFPYQQQHGYFATGFYTSVLPTGPRAVATEPEQYTDEEMLAGETAAAEEDLSDENAEAGFADTVGYAEHETAGNEPVEAGNSVESDAAAEFSEPEELADVELAGEEPLGDKEVSDGEALVETPIEDSVYPSVDEGGNPVESEPQAEPEPGSVPFSVEEDVVIDAEVEPAFGGVLGSQTFIESTESEKVRGPELQTGLNFGDESETEAEPEFIGEMLPASEMQSELSEEESHQPTNELLPSNEETEPEELTAFEGLGEPVDELDTGLEFDPEDSAEPGFVPDLADHLGPTENPMESPALASFLDSLTAEDLQPDQNVIEETEAMELAHQPILGDPQTSFAQSSIALPVEDSLSVEPVTAEAFAIPEPEYTTEESEAGTDGIAVDGSSVDDGLLFFEDDASGNDVVQAGGSHHVAQEHGFDTMEITEQGNDDNINAPKLAANEGEEFVDFEAFLRGFKEAEPEHGNRGH